MPKYRLQLETVLDVREARREQARSALAEAFRAAEVLGQNRFALAEEQSQLHELRRSAAAGPVFDVNRMVEAQQYDLVLRARQQDLARQESLLAIETERRRLALVEAERDVKALELLNDRHRRAFHRQTERAAAKLTDEAAAGRWLRARGKRS
jgi:flagellar export protein FliJ